MSMVPVIVQGSLRAPPALRRVTTHPISAVCFSECRRRARLVYHRASSSTGRWDRAATWRAVPPRPSLDTRVTCRATSPTSRRPPPTSRSGRRRTPGESYDISCRTIQGLGVPTATYSGRSGGCRDEKRWNAGWKCLQVLQLEISEVLMICSERCAIPGLCDGRQRGVWSVISIVKCFTEPVSSSGLRSRCDHEWRGTGKPSGAPGGLMSQPSQDDCGQIPCFAPLDTGQTRQPDGASALTRAVPRERTYAV